MLQRRVLDVRPLRAVRMVPGNYVYISVMFPSPSFCQEETDEGQKVRKRTVVVRTDGEAARLAGGNGLRDAKQRGAERADALLEQRAAGVERGAGRRDLDAEAVGGDARGGKFARVGAGVGERPGLVVGGRRRGLQEKAALNLVLVEGA